MAFSPKVVQTFVQVCESDAESVEKSSVTMSSCIETMETYVQSVYKIIAASPSVKTLAENENISDLMYKISISLQELDLENQHVISLSRSIQGKCGDALNGKFLFGGNCEGMKAEDCTENNMQINLETMDVTSFGKANQMNDNELPKEKSDSNLSLTNIKRKNQKTFSSKLPSVNINLEEESSETDSTLMDEQQLSDEEKSSHVVTRNHQDDEALFNTRENQKEPESKRSIKSTGGTCDRNNKKKTKNRKGKTSMMKIEESCVCRVCKKQFSDAKTLKMHRVEHERQKAHVCKVCGVVCSNRSSVKEHSLIHKEAQNYPCSKCSKVYQSESGLRKHKREHKIIEDNVILTCDKCMKDDGKSEDFFSLPELERHKRKAHQEMNLCPICGQCFANISGLNLHIHSHNEEKPYQCSECPKAFTHKSYLALHKRYHSRDYSCEICGKTFSRIQNVEDHMFSHKQEYNYPCDVCNRLFKSPKCLRQHMKSHTSERNYECDHCGKRFKTNSTLVQHKRIHAVEKSFKCSHCKKAFHQSEHLRRHERIHTGDKPYACQYCDMTFTQSSNRNGHMKRRHGVDVVDNQQ